MKRHCLNRVRSASSSLPGVSRTAKGRPKCELRLDEEVNIIYIEIKDKPAERTVEIQEGILADFDENDELIGLEILNEGLFLKALREHNGEISIPEKLSHLRRGKRSSPRLAAFPEWIFRRCAREEP